MLVELYVIRHAEAVEVLPDSELTDALRPLTPNGEAQCRALAAAFIAHGLRPEALVASPLVRAQQTAEQLAHKWGFLPESLITTELLVPPARFRKLTKFLRTLNRGSLAIIGHEPDLSAFVAWVIGSRKAHIDMAKAAVACIRCDGEPSKGSGELRWLVPPAWYGHCPQND